LDGLQNLGEHVGSPLGSVMQWFKTMSTNEYIRGVKTLDWKGFDGKLWQRNYWEHIIRDERSYDAIRKYIINNPRKWDVDKLK
jgi:REP element-mobilizing transposase RayT